MSSPELKVSVVSNVWIKQMVFKKSGDLMEGHKHTFDHQTLLGVGGFEIELDGELHQAAAPTILFIEKGKEHSIRALTDNAVAYCIHPIRDGERVEDIVDPEDMPKFGGSLKHSLVE